MVWKLRHFHASTALATAFRCVIVWSASKEFSHCKNLDTTTNYCAGVAPRPSSICQSRIGPRFPVLLGPLQTQARRVE